MTDAEAMEIIEKTIGTKMWHINGNGKNYKHR